MARVRNLILVLGDQLTPNLSSLAVGDPARDRVLMAELHDEATYVRHHKKKIAFLFSAMRHFAGELRSRGWAVDYVKLDAPEKWASFSAQLAEAVADRLEAARACGMTEVPCVRIKHLTGDQKRAFALADNRLAELSCWDDEVLGLELGELSAPDLDLGFDFEITGFDSVDVDRLTGTGGGGGLAKGQEFSEDPDDVVPELMAEAPAISKPGDLWQLGPHRLLCGDALEPQCYARLLGTGESSPRSFADPPYNVPIARNVTSVAGFREFVMASGEMSEPDFIAFLTRALTLMREVVGDGAILHVCMDWRHASSLWAASAGGAPRAEEHLRVGEAQCRNGQLLPQPARVRLRAEGRHGQARQQFRPRRAWPASQQCLALSLGRRPAAGRQCS